MKTKYSALFRLTLAALPQEHGPEWLKSQGPAGWWCCDDKSAYASVLRQCIDWQAYLVNNPDVVDAGMDPLDHFLQHGIFEGRKIQSAAFNRGNAESDAPEVSVIIINYNNATLLGQALISVVRQTHDNIEIVVVDDCSTDSSRSIINEAAQNDARIRPVLLPVNSSAHMARATGVEEARGKYIMFLDSDDFLLPKACETALKAIEYGYDIVSFGVKVIPYPGTTQQKACQVEQSINRFGKCEISGDSIAESIFIKKRLSPILWNKIYRANIAKVAFSDMEIGHFNHGEDRYELLALAFRASKLATIDDKLYVYRYGGGISCTNNKNQIIRQTLGCANLLDPISKLCKNSKINGLDEAITRIFLLDAMSHWRLTHNKAIDLVDIYKAYSLDILFNFMIECSSTTIGETAKIFHNENLKNIKVADTLNINIIGILVKNKNNKNLCELVDSLQVQYADRLKIIVFLDDYGMLSKKSNKYSKLIKLDKNDKTSRNIQVPYWSQLLKYISSERIDSFIIQDDGNANLLWYIIMCKLLGLTTIVYRDAPFYSRLLNAKNPPPLDDEVNVLKNADLVICSSRLDEVFMRTNGIHALYINRNDRSMAPCQALRIDHRNEILVWGKPVSSSQRVVQSLLIFKEALRTVPDATLVFTGAFLDAALTTYIFDRATKLGLEGKVVVENNPERAPDRLSSASVLLSTAWAEDALTEIYEARARGLPVVAYDLPALALDEDPDIIRVEQSDWGGAARAVAHHLAKNAEAQTPAALDSGQGENTGIRWQDRLAQAVINVRRYAEVHYYSVREYQAVMNAIIHYGAHLPPSVRS